MRTGNRPIGRDVSQVIPFELLPTINDIARAALHALLKADLKAAGKQ